MGNMTKITISACMLAVLTGCVTAPQSEVPPTEDGDSFSAPVAAAPDWVVLHHGKLEHRSSAPDDDGPPTPDRHSEPTPTKTTGHLRRYWWLYLYGAGILAGIVHTRTTHDGGPGGGSDGSSTTADKCKIHGDGWSTDPTTGVCVQKSGIKHLHLGFNVRF